jgi:hypothetical protein
MDHIFPEETKQKKLNKIIENILGENKVTIFIGNFVLREREERKESHIACDMILKDKTIKIKGAGSGAVDALYGSIISRMAKEYPSLKSVKFEDFSIRVKFKHSRRWNKADAPVEIKMVLRSDNRNNLYFSAESSSLMVAAIAVIRKAITFLINSELSIKQLQKDIQSARDRNRNDLVSEYTLQLSEVIYVANYEHLF